MLNILVCNYNNTSFGDHVIDFSTRYLIDKAMKKLRQKDYMIIPYKSLDEEVSLIKYADLIIFAGGGLIKYFEEKIVRIIETVVTEAERLQIPVMFNAVGVEGYEEKDERCQRLKHVLESSCVKVITTRDDVVTLKNQYAVNSKRVVCKKVADPAVWSAKAFDIKKDKETSVLGIGVIREDIFEEYGWSYAADKVISLYCDIIKRLEEKKEKWVIFTNGARSDAETARKVLERLSIPEEGHLLLPESPEELIRMVATFKGVISARLHGNIIAYALGIPSVGLVWNQKLVYFGETIGFPERFVKTEQFQGEYIADLLLKTCTQNYSYIRRYKLEQSVYRQLYRFVKKYSTRVRKTDRSNRNINASVSAEWEKRLFAVSMGGYHETFFNTNSLEALKENYKRGIRVFETDIYWDEKRIAFVEQKKYQTQFTTPTMGKSIKFLQNHSDVRFIFDINEESVKSYKQIFNKLNKILEEHKAVVSQISVKLKSKNAISILRTICSDVDIIFYLSEKALNNRNEYIEFCKENGISHIMINVSNYSSELMRMFKEADISLYVCPVNHYGQIIDMIADGVDAVGTTTADIGVLKSLQNSYKESELE